MNVNSPIEDTNGPWYLDDLSVGLRPKMLGLVVVETQFSSSFKSRSGSTHEGSIRPRALDAGCATGVVIFD